MISFLEKVADATIDLPSEQTLIVFPTQRACQEYRKIITQKMRKAGRLPAILPIRDLLYKLDSPVIADDLTLLLELYAIYRSLYGGDDFNSFLSYGEQLIDDFNEIDRQLIHSDFLFEEINDLKTLEERFSPGEEDYEFIKNFWSEFLHTPLSPLQNSFLQYWKQMRPLYHAFRKRLNESNIAYEGMAWRYVSETMPQQKYFSKFSNIIFAGFYALNKTEERILEFLHKHGKLLLFKDADVHYTDKRWHEAGMFLRKGMLAGAEIPWTDNNFSISKEEYIVKACTGRLAMARELAHEVHSHRSIGRWKGEPCKEVIVLADEGLLLPLLHFCGRLGIPANPSMGFSLKHHPLMRLLQLIKSTRQFEEREINNALRFKKLQEFCAEPLFFKIFSNAELGLVAADDVTADLGRFHPYFRDLLFMKPGSVADEKAAILDLLSKFRFSDKEWIQQIHYHLIHAVENTFTLLEPHEEEISLSTWWLLFMDAIGKVRMPFASENNGGIAIMGFLETRLLDFDSVYIAPLNEGVLPGATTSKSLIPYSLRKAYHLPCKEEQDAITSYHFYRLLQRVKNIYLFYNTDLNDTGGGERSRYLFQLHHELLENVKPVKLLYLQEESRLIPEAVHPITIQKSNAILDRLREKYMVNGDSIAIKGLSASAISSYISCKLRFYFDQVVYLKPDSKPEGLSAAHFGNVLHKAMELIYSGKNAISEASFSGLMNLLPEYVEKAIRITYEMPVTSGHDYLMKGVLTELVRRIVEYDLKQIPFEIMGLERNLNATLHISGLGDIRLKGIIDRVDFKDKYYRILDYKTGNEKVNKKIDYQQLFSDPSHKLNLQLLLYCFLVKENMPQVEGNLKAGIFKLKEFDDEITWLDDGKPVDTETILLFLEGLKLLVSDIFNPSVPFDQTSDIKRCRFCDYHGLCQRQNT